MVAGKLGHLAREVHAAIGEQDFGFADATGIEDNLPPTARDQRLQLTWVNQQAGAVS